jgi:hypothetical protein
MGYSLAFLRRAGENRTLEARFWRPHTAPAASLGGRRPVSGGPWCLPEPTLAELVTSSQGLFGLGVELVVSDSG